MGSRPLCKRGMWCLLWSLPSNKRWLLTLFLLLIIACIEKINVNQYNCKTQHKYKLYDNCRATLISLNVCKLLLNCKLIRLSFGNIHRFTFRTCLSPKSQRHLVSRGCYNYQPSQQSCRYKTTVATLLNYLYLDQVYVVLQIKYGCCNDLGLVLHWV